MRGLSLSVENCPLCRKLKLQHQITQLLHLQHENKYLCDYHFKILKMMKLKKHTQAKRVFNVRILNCHTVSVNFGYQLNLNGKLKSSTILLLIYANRTLVAISNNKRFLVQPDIFNLFTKQELDIIINALSKLSSAHLL